MAPTWLVPPELSFTLQVTPELVVPETVAVNWSVPPNPTVALVGEIVMLTLDGGGGFELVLPPPPPPQLPATIARRAHIPATTPLADLMEMTRNSLSSESLPV